MLEDFSLEDEFDEGIDLTPLIDVVFILLIFFFISSTFVRPSLPVNLPSASSSSASSERREQLVITINAQGELFNGSEPLTRADVPALLKANPGKPINLFVDRVAPFESFLSVVDEARRLNRTDLSITTLPESRE